MTSAAGARTGNVSVNIATVATAVTAPNQFVETNGRCLAYRSVGTGKPLVLCTRFRGNLDVWDPAFLDALAANGFRVITFDYSGLGLSTGVASYDPMEMAGDSRDLIDALGLEEVVIAGWSLGGLVVQVMVAHYPDRISHAVAIGCVPPGPNVKPAEQLFYDTALIPEYGFEEEVILFFEPRSQKSREAARCSVDRIAQRREGRSRPVPLSFAKAHLGSRPRGPLFSAGAVLDALKTTSIPILHVGGDHDIIFPVENWYALNQQLPTVQLLTYPSAGHGPHHEHPQATAEHIATFVRTTSRGASARR
jgi:pimeloyl-ACP methyl ester carboxylesterase